MPIRRKEHDKNTLEIYLEHLADIPFRLLEQAARRHIQTSNWFPRIAQLRETAGRLAGTHDFANLEPNPEDALVSQAAALESDFYHMGKVDVDSWEQLERGFEHAGRPHRAQHTRTKLQRLHQIANKDKAVILVTIQLAKVQKWGRTDMEHYHNPSTPLAPV